MALNAQTIAEIQKKASQGKQLVSSTPEKQAIYNQYLANNQPKQTAPAVNNTVQKATQAPVTAPKAVQTTYSTPDVYKNSDNVKTFNTQGQQLTSASGYNTSNTTGYQASSDVTNLLNNLKNQEALARDSYVNNTGNYNDIFGERNNQSAQLLDAIVRDSGGNASLADIEAILGRRLENQEFQKYRENFTQGSLQQSQLNNLFEHDFATRNNGENYQYNLNYLNGDTNAPITQGAKDYLSSNANAGQQNADSLNATQNYFNQRGNGYIPEYINNTANPSIYGELDVGDFLSGGNALQKQIDAYNFQQANPNFDYNAFLQQLNPGVNQLDPNSGFTPSPNSVGGNINSLSNSLPNFNEQAFINALSQLGGQQLQQQPGQFGQSTGTTTNTGINDEFNKYLLNVFGGQ